MWKHMNKPTFITLAALLLAAVASLPAEPVGVATSQYARPPQETWKVELLKQPLRAYCIDFNWLVDGKHVFPEPGHWADADPAAHVKWYKDAGVNCIQTFVLSANGYAWYKGGPVPEQPGLKHDFLPEVVKLGHKERMLVMGYYCIGANTLWGKLHPEQSYGTPSWMHIPLTKEYIEYLCVSVEDALKKTGMDGFMLDWMVNTSGKWLDCEKTMYQELLGVPFPGDDKISPADLEKFNDLAIKRCWTRIRDTARKVKPDCILWPNGINHLKLEGADWLLNEGPDVETTEAARKELNGRPVRLIQNQVGWSNHDARKVFCDPANRDKDFYGFAAPYDNSLPLPVAEYLKRPVADFNGTSAMTINDRNIAALIRFYLGKPVEPPPPWPEALRCEYLNDPLGIDVAKPRLSWTLNTVNPEVKKGIRQTSYQILVASSLDLLRKNQGDLWDSGKVESDQSVSVEYQGKPLESQMRCFWKVRVWTSSSSSSSLTPDSRLLTPSTWSEPASWTMGMLKPENWSAKWIRSQENDVNVSPWLRKSFDLTAVPSRASVCVNIAGYAELYINGQKVGVDVLTPAVSDHKLQVFYNTYDVTPLLKKGRNTIGLWLGRGWADGVPLVRAELRAQVGGKPWFLGTDASWKTRVSHYRWIGGRQWNDFGGERVDANAAVPEWSRETFDDSSWTNAVETSAPKGQAVAQQAPLNRIGKEIPAVAVTDIGGGKIEIDFGTALTGWLRLKMPALKAGTVVKMTFADVRRKKGDYQHFKQFSEFVSAGGVGEVFQHKFNYAGFRYVIVEGLPSAPAKEDAVALLIESDLETAGSFECSNELFNRIHRVNQWTQRCLNLGGYYVDCPHRERMGYGDGQVATEGFMTSFHAYGYYRKWLFDWRLRQGADGGLPHVAPFGQGGGGPGWPGLLAATTWRHYLYYGDRRVLEENFDAIRRYVDYLETLCKDNILRKYGGQWDFIGDWVPPNRGMDTKNWPGPQAAELFNNCYRIYQMDLLMRMAETLGRKDEVERCQSRLSVIRPAVHAAFYDQAAGHYVIDEQAYYVMPLMTGVAPESERAAILKKLAQNILVKNKGHLDTGMLGTYFMMEYLRETGRSDLVFTMFNQTTHPGWGYMLEQGATTLWEQWNGHWSHIHSCFTSPDNWFYQGLAGIRPDPSGPGFKKIIIKPEMAGDLTWVKGHHDSPYGRIVNNWKREGDKLTMDVTIPLNTTATVHVPAKDAAGVTESGKPAAKSDGAKFLRMENGVAVYEVGSGVYCFQSTTTGDAK
jgi:alpha-L-rhamnosidase